IVFVNVVDPVGGGFVASLARPGGTSTGFTVFEYSIAGKWLELLKQIAPNLRYAHQFLRAPAIERSIIASPTVVDPNITTHRPSPVLQSLEEPRDAGLPLLIVGGQVHERTDAAHSLARLGVRRDRPRCRAAEQHDELAALHYSITSSVRGSSEIGGSRPSALAVFRLMTSSNLSANWIGKSPGLAPLRMRST